LNFYLINIETSDHIEVTHKMTIGRKEGCTVVIKDDLISGRHCRFHVGERAIFIEDLNASNPVQVNNIQMDSKSRIKVSNKDKIKIGSIEFYLTSDLPSQDISYKSLILEKVKIHETFDSDVDYEQYSEHWHEAASKKRSEVVNIQKRLNRVTSKKEKVENFNKELKSITKNLKLHEEKISTVKKYSDEEIAEKIEYFTERINFFTEKRDEILAAQVLKSEYDQLKNKQKSIKSKIEELAGDEIEKEHQELSKLYKTEVDALSIIDKKIKEDV